MEAKMKAVCRFRFPEDTARELIEGGIAEAIFNAECLFGKPNVRVSGVAYYISGPPKANQCVIDVSSEVGEHVAQVFTGIMLKTLGEDKFSVTRLEASRNPDTGLPHAGKTA
uniref:Uncharacterized protein n=1 Tax=bacterium enrichment culture clone fosmid MGS-K1 TaxID=1549356 RepID=A0A0B5KQT2_9BACT|nr:hypothetical protein [bacterium enrichment culture clone fosmid MGS-K1]